MALVASLALSIAAVATVTAPDDDACPARDAPGEIGAFDVDDAGVTVLDVRDGAGTLTFTRTFRSTGAGPAATSTTIDFAGARMVVVGASVSGTTTHGALKKHALHVEDATDAQAEFDAWRDALERGVDEPKEGAHEAGVLLSKSGDGVQIDVAAPCSVRTVVVTVAAAVASVPVDGAWRFEVPHVAPALRVTSSSPLDLTVDDKHVRRDLDVTLEKATDDKPLLGVVARPLHAKPLRARGFTTRIEPQPLPAAPAAPDGRDGRDESGAPDESVKAQPVVVTRAELDLPKPLTEAPAGLRFVFVVDASVSVGEKMLAKELMLAREVLDAAPADAKYALVSFARKAHVAVSPWHDEHDALDALESGDKPAIAIENGSDVVSALKLAYGIAADVGDDEVARVVVFSDMRLQDAIDDAALTASFVSKHGDAALTHVVVGSDIDVEDTISWTRSFADEDARAKGPESTGGIWIELANETGGTHIVDDERALATHLVHPTRIDRPRVVVAGVDVLDAPIAKHIDASPVDDPERALFATDNGLPVVLVEGSGIRVESALDASAFPPKKTLPSPEVRGSLWATPFSARADRDDALLGLVAVDDVGDALADDVVRAIATKAHAVSRVTSLLSLPTWRPPSNGTLEGGFGCGCGSSSMCDGYLCGLHGCGVSTRADLHELDALTQWLAEDARACLVPSAAVTIEIADREILDVAAVDAGPCVVERTWKRRLDLLITKEERGLGKFAVHRTYAVRTPARTDDATATPAAQ